MNGARRGTVAVVGAGIAGLAAASRLRAAGVDFAVFDKGRSVGGRVATRRRAAGQWDHGAQFCTARDPRFAARLAELAAAGAVAPWAGPFHTLTDGELGADPRPGQRWVGVPGMSALARGLAGDLPVTTGVRCEALRRDAAGWWLHLAELPAGVEREVGPFAALVLAIPPAQADALLVAAEVGGPVAAAAVAHAGVLQPCCAALVAFAEPVAELGGGLFVVDRVLAWAAHDGGKPGRGGAATWVLHGAAGWSEAVFAQDPAGNAQALLAAFARCLGRALPAVQHVEGHRWHYALAAATADVGAVVDAEAGLVLCGDAFTGGRVEGAWLAGERGAALLLDALRG